ADLLRCHWPQRARGAVEAGRGDRRRQARARRGGAPQGCAELGALMQALDAHDALAPYRRLTIKIGSALLVDGKTGKLRAEWLASLAEDLAALRARGVSLVIVSSGAIALGRRLLGLDAKVLPLEQSQAAASAGQI